MGCCLDKKIESPIYIRDTFTIQREKTIVIKPYRFLRFSHKHYFKPIPEHEIASPTLRRHSFG